MYSCVPAKLRRQRLVEGVGQDLRGPVRVGVRLDDLVERPLHVEHHRVRAAAVAASTPSTWRGVLSSSVRPIDWASRRAGSMVSTTTCRPRSAARSAERGRGRGLAHAAGAAADDDPGRAGRRCSRVHVERCAGMLTPLPGRAELCGQLVQAGQVDPVGQHRQLVASAGRALEQPSRSRFSSATRCACSAASATRPSASPRSSPRSRPPSGRAASSSRRARPRRPRPGRPRASTAGRTMLTMMPPSRQPGRACSSATPSRVSCTGISSSSVTKCTAVCGDADHRSSPCRACVCDRARPWPARRPRC